MIERKALRIQRPPQTSDPASQTWNSVPWHALEQQVLRIQKRIYRASQRGDKRAVHTQQLQLIESEAARLVAVRRVTQHNEGKDTAGVDGIKSLTPTERLAMASAIHPTHWNHQPPRPVRRGWIPYVDTCPQTECLLLLR